MLIRALAQVKTHTARDIWVQEDIAEIGHPRIFRWKTLDTHIFLFIAGTSDGFTLVVKSQHQPLRRIRDLIVNFAQ